jgi:hypothetical protein
LFRFVAVTEKTSAQTLPARLARVPGGAVGRWM